MFTITNYSAFRSTARPTFDQAVEVAQGYAAEGNLPATILGASGDRWVVWMGQTPDYMTGSARTGVPVCEACERDAWCYWHGATGEAD